MARKNGKRSRGECFLFALLFSNPYPTPTPPPLVFLSLVPTLSQALLERLARWLQKGWDQKCFKFLWMFDSSLWILHLEPEPSFRLIQTYRPFQSQPAFGDRFVQVTAPLIVWHHARYSIGFASGIRSKLGGVSGNVGKMSLCNMGTALLQHSAKLAILRGGWKDSAVVDCYIFVSAQFASLFRFFFFLGWIFPCENL